MQWAYDSSYWGVRGAALATVGGSEGMYQSMDAYEGVKVAYDAGKNVAAQNHLAASNKAAGGPETYMARLGARQTFGSMEGGRDDDYS